MVPQSVCPACAIREQAIWARERFKGPDYSPLFPDATGGTVTRHAFVHHIEAGFHMLGVDTVSHTGSALAGEHSYRNGIAVYLAGQRIEVWIIQGLLRHSFNSQIVLRYIREAHVKAATDLAEQATLAKNMSAVRAELRMLQNATAGPRPVQDPPAQRTAGGHPLPILDKTDLGTDEQDEDSTVKDALQAWTAWPGFIKETLDPVATAAAITRRSEAAAASTSSPAVEPDTDLMYVVPSSVHGKHGSTLGKIHTIDPSDLSRTLCGWYYERFNSSTHIFSTTPFPSENVAIEGALRCSSCTRCEEQRSL